jgi:ketosteroid isomerase-like protein
VIARICVAVAIALAAGCGGGGKKQVQDPAKVETKKLAPAEVVTAIKGQLELYRQGFKIRSLEALERLYSHGPEVAITHQGSTRRGWEQIRPYLKALLRDNSEIVLTLSEVTVSALGGGGASVTAELRRRIGDGTTSVTETGTLNLAFRHAGDRWLIVHEHFSYPATAP